MNSVFGLQMENYQGDLNDIVRASAHPSDIVPQVSWQQFPSDPLNFSSLAMEDHRLNVFGDPFSTMRDPLLHELNVVATGSSSTYYSSPNSANDHHMNNINFGQAKKNIEDTSNFSAANSTVCLDDIATPCNIFSRIQISQSSSPLPEPPCDPPVMAAAASGVSPRRHKAPAVLPSNMINAESCLIDNTTASVPVQISSPRNLGIKRRKSQEKKVVCIPAPAAANSRSSGEVVPSDLWAWRKYGQKPIKGSPYPRGYYRCSSSKGCSARKQVERSRTDPNMLVITYTSEHNHPWPTQRNALAGSTRSQPSKANATGSKKGSPSNCQPQKTVKESSNNDTASASVKEEMEMEDIEKQPDIDEAELGEGNPQTYRPALPESQQSEDFFADLDEIETDPLNLLFQQGFNGDKDERKENKPMDPFSLFYWSGNNNNNNNASF